MAFKQPNLVHSDDTSVAAAASDLLERRCHGTTARPSDFKVLWMDDDCALVKRNAFSYGGSNYSGSVYLVDCKTGGSTLSRASRLERVVHVCGKHGFCLPKNYTGGYGRLTADILHDLIVVAPLDFMVWKAEVARAGKARSERARVEKAYHEKRDPLIEAMDRTVGDLLEAAAVGFVPDIVEAAHEYRSASATLDAFPATLDAFIAAQE